MLEQDLVGIAKSVGELNGQQRSIIASLERMRQDLAQHAAKQDHQFATLSKRLDELEVDGAVTKDRARRQAAIRGTVLTLFGGTVGALLIKMMDRFT